MKVLVNGGLNLSELDGWWAEAYSPEVVGPLGRPGTRRRPGWDAQEAENLYGLLEDEVIPEFYERDESGMPANWLGRIRESMARLTPEFSATRAIREYTESHYLSAASRYRDRAANDGAVGSSLLEWKQTLIGTGARCISSTFESTPTMASISSRWRLLPVPLRRVTCELSCTKIPLERSPLVSK